MEATTAVKCIHTDTPTYSLQEQIYHYVLRMFEGLDVDDTLQAQVTLEQRKIIVAMQEILAMETKNPLLVHQGFIVEDIQAAITQLYQTSSSTLHTFFKMLEDSYTIAIVSKSIAEGYISLSRLDHTHADGLLKISKEYYAPFLLHLIRLLQSQDLLVDRLLKETDPEIQCSLAVSIIQAYTPSSISIWHFIQDSLLDEFAPEVQETYTNLFSIHSRWYVEISALFKQYPHDKIRIALDTFHSIVIQALSSNLYDNFLFV